MTGTQAFLDSLKIDGVPTLPDVTMDMADLIRHDAERITKLTLTTGAEFLVRDVLEVGPDWVLIVTGYGEAETKVLIRTATIATVAL